MAYFDVSRLLCSALAAGCTGCVSIGPLEFGEEDPVVETICNPRGAFELSTAESRDPSTNFHANADYFPGTLVDVAMEDFGLNPESEQDVADFKFVFSSTRLIVWIQLSEPDREAGDARDTLTLVVYRVADVEVANVEFPILDTSRLAAAMAEGVPGPIATRFRELVTEARELGSPFAVLAYCPNSENALSCTWSETASHPTSGSVVVGAEYDRRAEPSRAMVETYLSNDILGSAVWDDASTVEFAATCMHLQ